MPQTPVIVFSHSWPEPVVQQLKQQLGDTFCIRTTSEPLQNPGANLSLFEGTQIYCTTSLDTVPAALIERLPPSVKLIANCGVGVDNIDLTAARDHGLMVTNTPDVVTEDTADLCFALILATCRRLRDNETLVRADQWTGVSAPELNGTRVNGKTLGIIGLGRIGQAVARRAAGFGMPVMYYSKSRKKNHEQNLQPTVKLRYCESLEELLSEADIISLHCPMTAENHHLIDEQALTAMKPEAILINTGRGELVDETALTQALQQGKIAAAGLDVYEKEPQISETLRNLPNTCLLPHIGSATRECRMDMVKRMLANVLAFAKKETPSDLVV